MQFHASFGGSGGRKDREARAQRVLPVKFDEGEEESKAMVMALPVPRRRMGAGERQRSRALC